MALINHILKSYLSQRIQRIEYAIKHPWQIQKNTLKYLLNEARNTEWGIKHHYEKIKSTDDYRSYVPVQTYDTLKSYILRMHAGEQNILWSSPIRWFAKSSGTTEDRSKFIPVSKQSLAYTHYRSGKDIMAIYAKNNPKTHVFKGKCLVLSGSISPNQPGARIYSGDISGVLIENLEWWVNLFRTPRKEIALLPDWETKIDRFVEETIHEKVTYLSGVPSWMLVLANRILEKTGKKSLMEVWPDLELFIHGAINFEPYQQSFQNIIQNPNMNYYETYNASEGFFALQDRNERGDMLLMMDYGIYYEFLPMDELSKENPRTLTLQEVETNQNYALIISTNAGLWRYMIGDTIKFTSLQPYRIAITGRTKHFINAFGEELVVENADKALTYACAETGARIKDYTVAPVYLKENKAGYHEWLIEFEKAPSDRFIFTQLLDQRLREVNSDYDAKRKGDLTLTMPVIRILPQNTFYIWMKSRGKLGGQHKVPRLCNDRKYADEILSLTGFDCEP